ncbi:hypothetical protein CAOG_08888 [Capsaspora owczarzaki ATCC 30864]|uniref:Beta-fructofuranosidase n=1 Tax=Capsaspora owczarzaki (strain ATCC 30864) TaxID=595528 RepID=A0A0D2WTA1_CAPO3|nr:hypothetical protein CAOG_08888 [Capsaspora owczarzaki ATCC 30864]KJE94858.1 hypothetical protein CAOG_008888 [Capsaspora owczarzaki ATCC 30864]|eukprot:XP_011270550.1 hypothetical protein CAOG_08888 [Capsaspora owczarzaki ATCC 30864]
MKLLPWLVVLLLAITAAAGGRCASAEYVEQRPGYHFTPQEGWMNDPNGPMYINGFYHLFYQCNPFNPWWYEIHWCHAISTDALHWTYLPFILAPDHDYDAYGVYSGSTTIQDNGVPVIVYTGVSMNLTQTQCVAYPANMSDPYLTNWTKSANNPIITTSGLPTDIDPKNFRDPTTAWMANGQWNLLVSGGIIYPNDREGSILLFTSPPSSSLSEWKFNKILYTNNDSGGMWNCPDFFQIDRSDPNSLWMLKGSIFGAYDAWSTLKYNQAQQVVELVSPSMGGGQFQYIDIGPSYYASKSFFDPNIGKQVLIGWLQEEENTTYSQARGWVGAYTLPRVVSLDTDNVSVVFTPHPNVVSLRDDNFNATCISLIPGFPSRIPLISDQLELIFRLQLPYPLSSDSIKRTRPSSKLLERYNIVAPDDTLVYGLNVRASNEDEEFTPMFFAIDPSGLSEEAVRLADPNDPFIATFAITRLNSSQAQHGSNTTIYGNFKVTRPQTHLIEFDMHVFIDHSVIEAYVQGGRLCASARVYPSREDSMFVEIFSDQAVVGEIVSLSSWRMLDSMPPSGP